MKLSILTTAALGALTACAAPTSPSASSPLTRRAATCWTNSVNDATTSTSPLVTDCQALADDTSILLPGGTTWYPTADNNNSFDSHYGTCGIRGVFTTGGSLPASEMGISPGLVSVTIANAIATKAVDGRVGATGAFACMIPGYKVQTGWVNYEIYTVAEE